MRNTSHEISGAASGSFYTPRPRSAPRHTAVLAALIATVLAIPLTAFGADASRESLAKAERDVRSRTYITAAKAVFELSKHPGKNLPGLEKALSNKEPAIVVYALSEIAKQGANASSLLPLVTSKVKGAERIDEARYTDAVEMFMAKSILSWTIPMVIELGARGPLFGGKPKKSAPKPKPPSINDTTLRTAYLFCVVELLGRDPDAILKWADKVPNSHATQPDLPTDIEMVLAVVCRDAAAKPTPSAWWLTPGALPENATAMETHVWFANALVRTNAEMNKTEDKAKRKKVLLDAAASQLDSEHDGTRWRAASILVHERFAPSDEEPMRRLLDDSVPAIRMIGVRALQRDHGEAPSDMEWILDAATDRSSEATSITALEILCHLSEPTSEAVQVLRETLVRDEGRRM